ncbi:unnamed protein product [Cylindrotheca closterium]|uniref:VPS9 domain-containing protein n=1 Tax=Cylindrotheca closterium TaxID=2856 RepID=A0AAD2CI53_9STRA|nr:unnamed protein product [Cylindrotheca closterium]
MSPTAAEDDSDLERAIALMSSNGCFHMKHLHSFQSVSFHLPFRSCVGCCKRLQLFGSTSLAQVVQCKSCGGFAHRSCAFSKSLAWKEACQVNQKLLQENGDSSTSEGCNNPLILRPMNYSQLEETPSAATDTMRDDSSTSSNSNLDHADRNSIFRTPPTVTAPDAIRRVVSEGEPSRKRKYTGKASFPFLSASKLFLENGVDETSGNGYLNVPTRVQRSQTWDGRCQLDSLLDKESGFCQRDGGEHSLFDSSFEWTEDGPPMHWANQDLLKNLPSKSSQQGQDPLIMDSAIHFASHTFSNVSRALHENIAVHFEPMMHQLVLQSDRIKGFQRNKSKDDEDAESQQKLEISRTVSCESESPSVAEVEGLLAEKLDKETSNKRLGLATVAGGVAGGIAGLMFAGPVGWVIGGKVGQTAGILGVVLEGSVSIGVFASGVAAGRKAGQQLQDKIEEKRILALGDGTKQRVLLVRPNVVVHPEWETIYTNARKSHPTDISFDIFPNQFKSAKKERYDREVDIVKTDEEELATGDKVLLLVSRQLNNRDSLPGHIYQKLLDTIRVRSASRGPLRLLFEEPVNYPSYRNVDEESGEDASDERKNAHQLRRARRQDAHAVIKYVTATLLEVRPGFSASPAITELTATAVESLVFGEAYDLIMEEIEADYADQDNMLLAKIAEFERQQWSLDSTPNRYKSNVSELALGAMHSLPHSHSVSDKLQCCTTFLERISDFFSVSSTDSGNSTKSIGADSLLKLVCQHLIMAKVPAINAQIAFLEEFARDEQLLRGKEGYSLVTLQASLHFLNSSNDFVEDIFEQDDDF